MSQLLYSPFPVAIRTAQHHLSVATASPPIGSRRPFPRCLLLKDAKKGTTAREDAEGSEKGTAAAAASVDEKYTQWKSPVPVLFDWLANNNLVWPFLSCRWGPQLEQATYKNRQRLYLSEQTDGSVSNTPVIANCEVVKPRVAVAAEHISQFNEDARSPFVKK